MTEQPPPGSGAPLQFDQVEVPAAAAQAVQVCVACRRQIADTYYATNGAVLCAGCGEGFRGGSRTASVGRLPTAVLYGAVTALAGTLVWYLVMKISGGSTFGILAIALGYLIGRAVRNGSAGRGGGAYQALAMVLTYASICASDALSVLRRFDDAPTHTVLLVFGRALAAPITSGFKDLIGLLIIGIALYQAWKINRPLVVSGPFRIAL